ncbi:MAG: hypothetical protein LBF40_10910 [Deltaproteobacteria bacterium]|jgi:hypothetical protein|nr:hypothetical protein [Deltaproteobacteria bacterium]
MENIILRKFSLAIILITMIALSACGKSEEQPTLKYKGEDFNVSVGEIGKGEGGKLMVRILTNLSFDTDIVNLDQAMMLAMSEAVNIIKVNIVDSDKTIPADLVHASFDPIGNSDGGKIIVNFNAFSFSVDTTELPEKIVVYNDNSPSLTFDGNTKELIKQ